MLLFSFFDLLFLVYAVCAYFMADIVHSVLSIMYGGVCMGYNE